MSEVNVTGKVMINTVLNGFAMEKYPASNVRRTLRAIEDIEDATLKRSNKKENMQTLAKYMAAELKGDTSEDNSTQEDSKLDAYIKQQDTFMQQQAEVNAQLLDFLKAK